MGGAAQQGGDRITADLDALLADHAAAGTPCALATVVRCEPPTSTQPGDRAVVGGDGRLRGWVGGSCSEPVVRREALRAIADGQPRLVRITPATVASVTERPHELTLATTCPSGGAIDIFIEPRLPKPVLVVIGDSPAAHTLVQLGSLLGFRTCAAHPGARGEDFTGAAVVLSRLDQLAALTAGHDSWAVVATMGHYDEDAVDAALSVAGMDVALVASSRRARAVLDALRRRGHDDAALARVRTPAGARAATQEEIALLALAEVVTVRRQRSVAPTPAPGHRSAHDAPDDRRPAEAPSAFATDPVCRMTVEVAGSRHHLESGGATVHFCSDVCQARFADAPATFPSSPPV